MTDVTPAREGAVEGPAPDSDLERRRRRIAARQRILETCRKNGIDPAELLPGEGEDAKGRRAHGVPARSDDREVAGG